MDNLENLEELEVLTESIESVEPVKKLLATKPKRTPTPKQLEVLKKARETMQMKAKENQIKKRLEDEAIEQEIERRCNEYKKEIENKIIKKAVSIKKKEIKKQAVLDEISDDETPMQKIKEISNKKVVKQLPSTEAINTKPKYIFV